MAGHGDPAPFPNLGDRKHPPPAPTCSPGLGKAGWPPEETAGPPTAPATRTGHRPSLHSPAPSLEKNGSCLNSQGDIQSF